MPFCCGLFFLNAALFLLFLRDFNCSCLQGRPQNTKTAKSQSTLGSPHEWVQSSEPQNDSVAADYGQMHEPKICWKWIFGPQFSWSACEQVCRVWPNQKSVCQEHRTSTFGLKLEWIPFLSLITCCILSGLSMANQDKHLNGVNRILFWNVLWESDDVIEVISFWECWSLKHLAALQ